MKRLLCVCSTLTRLIKHCNERASCRACFVQTCIKLGSTTEVMSVDVVNPNSPTGDAILQQRELYSVSESNMRHLPAYLSVHSDKHRLPLRHTNKVILLLEIRTESK